MFKKHPKGLTLLFSTELWERFSYYGMRALLVLYMTKALDYSDPKALGVYGAYGALVYATPLLGGLLADRILGQRNSIVLGAILMTLGHFMMAFDTIITFYTALGLLVVGNGFFKPNMAPLLGKLYRDDDPLREGAFTIFYMGVNIGAFVAPLACGELAKIFGWHAGFSLAGFGMLFGLVIFYGQQKIFGKDGLPPSSGTRPLLAGLTPLRLVWIGAFLSIPFFALLMNQSEIMSYLLFVLGVVALGYVAYNGFRVSKIEGARLLVAMILIFFSILFWAFYFQAGGSLTLFADRNIDRDLGFFTVSAAQLEAVNALWILILALPLARAWEWLSKSGREPSIPAKFAYGTITLGLSFLIFSYGRFLASEALIPLTVLIFGYMIFTLGELLVSPVGLSMVTRLSPAKIVSFMTGVWFLSSSFANYIAALIGKMTAAPPTATGSIDPAETLGIYTTIYEQLGFVAIAAGLLLLVFNKPLTRLMHLDD